MVSGRSGSDELLPNNLVFAALFDRLSDGAVVFESGGDFQTANAAFIRRNNVLADLFQPELTWELFLYELEARGVFSDEICRQLDLLSRQIEAGHTPDHDLTLPTPDGRVQSLRLERLPGGAFALVQQVVSGVGAVEAEADLILSKVLEACPASLTMSRIGSGQVIYRSPAAAELLGNSRTGFEHFVHREERADFITALLPDGSVNDMRFTGRRPDGTTFPAAVSARLIEYRNEEVIVANIVDLTESQALQATLVEQKEQLHQQEKLSALGELLAGVAHELNNPLSVVVGNAMMLREDSSDPAVVRRVDKIGQAAERCVRIVRSFLGLARNDPQELTPVDLHELIEEAIRAIHAENVDSTVAIEVIERAGLPPVRADAVQITQVVINLIINARQSIETSGIGNTIRVGSATVADGEAVTIEISDNGPGVDEKIRGRIFEPLFTTKSKGKGTGVGLAFCHRIVTSHGGTLRLVSSDGPGATFVVKLPVWRTDGGGGPS